MPTILPFPARRTAQDAVRAAYDALAPAYDVFTAGHRHDLWLDAIEEVARTHGLRGERLLDIACGTGKSFLPLLQRGYAVTACDLSPQMARRAADKAPTATVLVADMRALPGLGAFDLVTCVDEALNYLLDRDELVGTLAGIARHLASDGIAVWDVTTLGTVRRSFSSDWIADRGGWFLAWHGTGSSEVGPGAVVEARVDAFQHRGTGWLRTTSRHRQRHWPPEELRRAAHEAGLEVLEILGQHRGARLERELDEDRHVKALFVARRASR
jgi:SAM-dependent methyltransferase